MLFDTPKVVAARPDVEAGEPAAERRLDLALVVEAAPAELRAAIDPWGPRPPSFAIMERLKRRFDPDGRLNPGRFVGGL
jgi:FAD/FMN-containing dehydrogenase